MGPPQGVVSVLPISQPPPAASNGATDEQAMTEDEIALYDRQIRLWGMRAQEQIRSAHVLLITMRALGNEVAKNLVLAGVGALTMMDHEPVGEADLGAQFLLAGAAGAVPAVAADASAAERAAAAEAAGAATLGRNRATAASAALRLMNPRVRVAADEGDVRTRGPAFYAGFDLVVATDLDPATLAVVNTATRLAGRPLYAGGSYGLAGFVFADLIEHDFVIVRDRGNVAATPGTAETRTRSVVAVHDQPGGREAVTKRELYSTWLLAADAAALPDALRRSPRRLRNVSPTLPCLRALWDFQLRAHARLPDPDRPADVDAFTRLVHRKQAALGIPPVSAHHICSVLQGLAGGRPAEIAPVVTAVGGQLAQDVINTLGHSQQPIQNLVVFDGADARALTYALHPDGPLGRQLLANADQPSPATAARALAAASGTPAESVLSLAPPRLANGQ